MVNVIRPSIVATSKSPPIVVSSHACYTNARKSSIKQIHFPLCFLSKNSTPLPLPRTSHLINSSCAAKQLTLTHNSGAQQNVSSTRCWQRAAARSYLTTSTIRSLTGAKMLPAIGDPRLGDEEKGEQDELSLSGPALQQGSRIAKTRSDSDTPAAFLDTLHQAFYATKNGRGVAVARISNLDGGIEPLQADEDDDDPMEQSDFSLSSFSTSEAQEPQAAALPVGKNVLNHQRQKLEHLASHLENLFNRWQDCSLQFGVDEQYNNKIKHIHKLREQAGERNLTGYVCTLVSRPDYGLSIWSLPPKTSLPVHSHPGFVVGKVLSGGDLLSTSLKTLCSKEDATMTGKSGCASEESAADFRLSAAGGGHQSVQAVLHPDDSKRAATENKTQFFEVKKVTLAAAEKTTEIIGHAGTPVAAIITTKSSIPNRSSADATGTTSSVFKITPEENIHTLRNDSDTEIVNFVEVTFPNYTKVADCRYFELDHVHDASTRGAALSSTGEEDSASAPAPAARRPQYKLIEHEGPPEWFHTGNLPYVGSLDLRGLEPDAPSPRRKT
ncbi:unnamed protein product [Amoebophrya sp. A120]|nr:unnamed protein product [Amoebophrya sp. A120]|eukprot:GSA120T00024791001.1